MRQALTPPFLLAAGILMLAGAAKLRSPAGAARALWTLGLPSRQAYVRALALAELALGADCALAPTGVGALALASLYGVFAVIALRLARRQASCGCFGGGRGDSPASAGQGLLSGVLALLVGASAVGPPQSLGWVFARPAPTAAVLTVGLLGAAYAALIAYTQLPRAWAAWSPR